MLTRQRVYEISVALLRIVHSARRSEFKNRLERLVFQFVESMSVGDADGSLKTIAGIQGIVGFGRIIYEVEPMNADAIIKDIAALESEIVSKDGLLPDINLQTLPIFDKEGGNKGVSENPAMQIPLPDVGSIAAESGNNAAKRQSKLKRDGGGDKEGDDQTKEIHGENDENAAKRQSAIIERIRKSGNQPILSKELFAAFPGTSKRTLRYDLQKLSMRGIIIKEGAGGPHTSYRIRNIT